MVGTQHRALLHHGIIWVRRPPPGGAGRGKPARRQGRIRRGRRRGCLHLLERTFMEF
jgi:hypothetical protein